MILRRVFLLIKNDEDYPEVDCQPEVGKFRQDQDVPKDGHDCQEDTGFYLEISEFA